MPQNRKLNNSNIYDYHYFTFILKNENNYKINTMLLIEEAIEIINSLIKASKDFDYDYHVGVVQSKDSFYGQHDPDSMAVSHILKEKWETWKKLGVLASEMECATLFTVASHLHVRAGGVLLAILNQERNTEYGDDDVFLDTERSIETAIEALKILIKEDNK